MKDLDIKDVNLLLELKDIRSTMLDLNMRYLRLSKRIYEIEDKILNKDI